MKGDDVPPTPEKIRQAVEDLIAMGLLIDSGRKRRARSGEMQTTGLSDWKVLRRQLSAGPILTEADDEAFIWLSTNAEAKDDVVARYYTELFRAATVCEGDWLLPDRFRTFATPSG
jgi:hypothetical protein